MTDEKVGTPGTIGELLQTLPHLREVEFADEILAMPVDCGCGEDCVKVLVAGNALIEMSADVASALRFAIQEQIEIFYFG